VVVFVIIAVVSIVSIPLGAPLQRNRDFSSTTADVWGTLRRAQAFAAVGVRSSGFGVHVVTSTNGAAYTLFQGATYAARDATYDEVFTLPATVMLAATISGNGPDIIFLQGSGKASTTATLTLTNDVNQTATITVNADGMVTR
jgi:hypothetical protein